MAEESKLTQIANLTDCKIPIPGNGSIDSDENNGLIHIYEFTIKKELGYEYRIQTEKVHYSDGDFFRTCLREINLKTLEVKRTMYFHKRIPLENSN